MVTLYRKLHAPHMGMAHPIPSNWVYQALLYWGKTQLIIQFKGYSEPNWVVLLVSCHYL